MRDAIAASATREDSAAPHSEASARFLHPDLKGGANDTHNEGLPDTRGKSSPRGDATDACVTTGHLDRCGAFQRSSSETKPPRGTTGTQLRKLADLGPPRPFSTPTASWGRDPPLHSRPPYN